MSDSPVIKLIILTTLSDLLVNIRSICVWKDAVSLVGPSISCVKSRLSVVCLRNFPLVLFNQLQLRLASSVNSVLKSHA